MARPRFHPLRIAEVRRETADCVSLSFDVPDRLRASYRFTPGQYLTLRTVLDGEPVRRSYSICSGLDDGELRVAIKLLENGAFSHRVHGRLQPGDMLDVMTPDGRFGVPIEPGGGRTLVAFAAGSGITPILSILKTTLHRERGQFMLFYGNRSIGSIIFREALEDLKDRFLSRLSVFHVLSRERQDVPALNGRLDAERVAGLMRTMVPADVAHAFVCGPQPMIEGLEKVLLDFVLGREQVHVERFTPGTGGRPVPVPPEVAEATPVAEATVIFEGGRSTFPVAANEAIIDAGLRAGLNLPFSCKGGMCCTCRARLIDGRVEMAVNYSLEPWETEAGYVLTCQSRPVTPRVVIDYDVV
ncbi:MAG TPA: 2Fe-2S iron-sulfur cluster-binding protein [Acetobacteraceae bacterium]|nr:2Fe-2S iron-sulfur cluster-binding protein [Acetobacteraceae bacterium]